MHGLILLEEIAIVAAAAVVVAVIAGRFRLPTVAGLLLSGALVGPNGLAFISDTDAIEVLAEVGVVLLLFTIGLEFSLERLRHIFQRVALGGVIQVLGTFGLVFAGAIALGETTGRAVFFGFAIALSSTAIVLRALSERRALDAPHGRFIVGTLIFQDLCVVPMVLIVPLLGSGSGAGSSLDIGIALGKAALVVAGSLAVSRLLVPRVMKWVEASRSREVFLLAVVSLCVGTAWLTSLAGLSLALGAFLGGMVVADTEYSHRAMGDILPLRDVFVSFFFVSLGMFFDVRTLVEHPVTVLLLLIGLVVGKGMIATASAILMRFPPRGAWLAGVGLAQFGEFGFVLSRLALEHDVVEPTDVEPLLTAGIISMFLTPLLLRTAPNIRAGERILAPLARLMRAKGIEEAEEMRASLSGHVVLIGYGVGGKLVTRSLRNVGAPHVILELNAENVRSGREAGDPVFYADATSAEALGHANAAQARCIVIMINDTAATYRVLEVVRRVAPGVAVVVRTHYLSEQEGVFALGAKRVISQEVEGGIEILAHVLRELEVPGNLIEDEVTAARESTRESARALRVPQNQWTHSPALAALKVETVAIADGSVGASHTLRELDLQARTGALVVAIQRGDDSLFHPRADDVLVPRDVAYLIGEAGAVRAATELLLATSAVDDDPPPPSGSSG